MARKWQSTTVTIPTGGAYSGEIVIAGSAWATLHVTTASHGGTKLLFMAIGQSGDTYGAVYEAGAVAERAIGANQCSVDVPAAALGYAFKVASDATSEITARLVPKD